MFKLFSRLISKNRETATDNIVVSISDIQKLIDKIGQYHPEGQQKKLKTWSSTKVYGLDTKDIQNLLGIQSIILGISGPMIDSNKYSPPSSPASVSSVEAAPLPIKKKQTLT